MEYLHVTTNASEVDVGIVHRFLSEESVWARGIPLATVQRSIESSLNFSGLVDGRQIAYARVISDYATFAYLADVFVLPEHRGRGHARTLMQSVMAHPQLQRLRRFMLATRTAHGLYAQFGFTPTVRPETLMECFTPDAYAHGL